MGKLPRSDRLFWMVPGSAFTRASPSLHPNASKLSLGILTTRSYRPASTPTSAACTRRNQATGHLS